MLVEFPIEEIRAATVILVDAGGNPLPVSSIVHANGKTGEGRIVGYGGIVYLNALKRGRNILVVTTPDGRQCRVHFTWQVRGNGIPRIGPLTCRLKD